MPYYHWPAEAIALLGTAPDSEIGRRLGLSRFAVRSMRAKRGIRSARKGLRARLLPLMGTMTDVAAGRQAGCSAYTVREHRRELGIPAFARQEPKHFLPVEAQALLGVMTDADLAARFGLPSSFVTKQRNKVGLPAFRKSATAAAIPLLGVASDAKVALHCGLSRETVRRLRVARGIPAVLQEMITSGNMAGSSTSALEMSLPPRGSAMWSDEESAMLGTMCDVDIAAQLGRTLASVKRERQRRKIPAYKFIREWTPEEVALLGKVGDKEVARRTGRSVMSVTMERYERGILGVGVVPRTL